LRRQIIPPHKRLLRKLGGSVSGSDGRVQFELIRVRVLDSWVLAANMQCKLFVALQLEVAHHFIERCAAGRTRRFEQPATFRATKTPKTLNPYQLAAHGLCRCAPTLTDSRRGVRLPSAGEAFSFRSGVTERAESTCANSDGLSGTLHR